jgi:membrane-bound metal-dependent hydrolase YbcI (DUF457 family)
MKGIAHFISAVAVASFVPQVVPMSAQGSAILVLAGLAGILPDTLDFRVARYLRRPDVEIAPDPRAPDPQEMARRLAAAIERAHHTGQPVHARLYSLRLGVDLWRRYSVRFAPHEVQVSLGPLVDASQEPIPGDLLDPRASSSLSPAAHAPLALVPIRCAGDLAIEVDVFSGPALDFRPSGDGVEVIFIPWHRRWSHSLTLTALLGASIALLLGPLYGLVYALGSLTHILEDQLGHMGSNLLYPFTRWRTRGLGLFHSGDVLPNLFAAWLSVVLLLLNLDRFSAAPVLDPVRYLILTLIFPWAAILGLAWWGAQRRPRHEVHADCHPTAGRLAELSAEVERPE